MTRRARNRPRAGTAGRVRWLGGAVLAGLMLLVLGLSLPGCGCLGGQTGQCGGMSAEDSSAPGECNPPRPLEFEQRSPLGYSAAEVIRALGGDFVAQVPGGEHAFWEAFALEEPISGAVDMTLTLEYFDGAVLERDCENRLDIDVVVTLELGPDLAQRSAVATLQGNPQRASLNVGLLPPVTGDASSLPITVAATITPTEAEGDLTAGSSNPQTSLPFRASRP